MTVIAAAAAVFTYPTWYGTLTQHVPAARQYLPVLETPSPETASTPSAAPIELHPASTPTPLFTPTTTNTATGSSWTPAECSWAQSTLTTDAQLDIAGGTNSPSLAAYYAGTAQDWMDAAAAVATVCGDPAQSAPFNLTWMVNGAALTQQGCAVPESWFTTAGAIHDSDARTNPQNADWDRQWSRNYARLNAMWHEVCG